MLNHLVIHRLISPLGKGRVRAEQERGEEQPVETTLYSLSESAPAPIERRDNERHLTLFRVGSLQMGDRRELCLIKNISAGGMMIRAYCALEAETRISVELKRGEQINGKVSWIQDGSAGITFDQHVDIVELLATSMTIASQQAVEPSYIEALATSQPSSRATWVWNSNRTCNVP